MLPAQLQLITIRLRHLSSASDPVLRPPFDVRGGVLSDPPLSPVGPLENNYNTQNASLEGNQGTEHIS